jgi:hypothetical protein
MSSVFQVAEWEMSGSDAGYPVSRGDGEISLFFRCRGRVKRPTSRRTPLEGTWCVRVWEVFRDLLLGINYVYRPVFKEYFLLLQSFPIVRLVRQRRAFGNRKEPKRYVLGSFFSSLGSKVARRGPMIPKFRFTVADPPTYSYPPLLFSPLPSLPPYDFRHRCG